MTKKHFEALATTLAETNASDSVIREIIDMCKESNPRFDEKRFRKAIADRKVSK